MKMEEFIVNRNKVFRSCFYLLSIMLVVFMLSACGEKEGSPEVQPNAGTPSTENKPETEQPQEKPEVPVKKDPITLTIFTEGVSPEEFDSRFRDHLESKFPHITLNYHRSGTGATITDLVLQNNIPDIMRIDVPGMKAKYLDLELSYGLDDLIKENNFDLKQFEPVFVQEMINAGRTGELYGLPVPPYFPLVLYYNVDLFDKFGFDYLVDGMDWDEIYDLAIKLTRTEDGQNYRGFSASVTAMLRDNPYSLPILDPAQDQLADPEKWSNLFNNLKRFYDIPNNAMASNASEEISAFGNGNVAMMANQHNIYLTIPAEVNWDIVTFPMLKDAPQLMGQRGPAYWALTRQGKHKEEAFNVITEMLSYEVQLADSKKGIPTTLDRNDIKSVLGVEHDIYSGKNMNAVNVYAPADPTPKRNAELVDVPGRTQEAIIFEAFQKLVTNEGDLNTVLREADERLRQEIEVEKSK